jgi:hypothetical protein
MLQSSKERVRRIEMEAVELSQQQSGRMAELPEDYGVVGVERKAPLVRKRTVQIIRIRQDGHLTRRPDPRTDRAASVSPVSD